MLTSQEMVQYKNTDDMEELKLMLKNDSSAYKAWFPLAEKYAKKMAKGEPIMFDVIVSKHCTAVESSVWRLARNYKRLFGKYLEVSQEQRLVIAWQWFYNMIMESYEWIINNKK